MRNTPLEYHGKHSQCGTVRWNIVNQLELADDDKWSHSLLTFARWRLCVINLMRLQSTNAKIVSF